jgi:hypothetical protein
MPVGNEAGPNVIQYIVVYGQEYRRQYTPDGVSAFDQIVDANMQLTQEYITYHAAEEAVPVATDDANYLAPDPVGTDDGQ